MSSMFKKKGAPAFKPKIPSARARPAAPAPAPAPAPVAKPTEPPVAIDDVVVEKPVGAPEVQQASNLVPETQTPGELAAPEQPRRRRRSSAGSTSTAVQDALTYKSLAEIARSEAEAASKDTLVEATSQVVQEVDSVPATRRQTRQRRASQAAQPKPTVETQQLETPPPTDQQKSTPASSESSSEAQTESQAEAPATAAPKATRSRRRAAAATEATGKDGEAAIAPTRKRARKNAATADDGEATPAVAKSRKRSAAAATGEKAAVRPRRARSSTPDDSETRTVDLQTLKMSDLTRDLHIGKKFSRHDELRERERRARVQAKLNKTDLAPSGDASRSGTPLAEPSPGVKDGTASGGATPGAASGTLSGGGGGGAPAPAPAGPQFRIVDGQIVVDQSSLIMDRHARAAAAHAGEDLETVEENDFTRLITSSSFMTTSKLRGPNIWTDDETELFYRGLLMFGTEFQMISHMFPGKQRRHVKLKFNREERCNPSRIDAALVGEKTTKMDIEEYKTLTGASFEPVESIMAEQRKIEEGYEAERKRIADEQDELMRKKREELFADDDDAAAAAAAAKKKGKKKGKQKVAYGLNGEPIVNDA